MPTDLPPLVGQSPAFLTMMQEVSRVAVLNRPVIVIGERGTGKELIADRLHYLSGRWAQPLMKLNCGALPETLVESELFGHEAGAFTGAVRRRPGRFERADGGSLFLDEIANAPLSVQEKILRVVEYGQFERLGSSSTLRCDVRIIAASNEDLRAAAEAGRFRHDLLDRLAFAVLTLPPLRARREDILTLADHFGRGIAVELGWRQFPGFAPAAARTLLDYDWPGNVRELKNVAERAVCQAPRPEQLIEAIELDPFASPYRPAARTRERSAADSSAVLPAAATEGPAEGFTAAVAGFERELLIRALTASANNQRVAAQALGLPYHQFRQRLNKHGLIGGRAGRQEAPAAEAPAAEAPAAEAPAAEAAGLHGGGEPGRIPADSEG
ncbi:DNA-binding transcriptional activator [uncultured Defluviicoccus sp.]|uniref:DNA-binding transcriptional activator n=1 Tax=metagenome TaxID=256318 RepID=A0A380TAV1_9ZZZZ|nr:DNA-binding transcriptional activator [uncultured Defluviicoccus sp.]